MLFLDIPAGFSPEETFLCGQCFRWENTPAGWRGIVAGRAVLVHAENGRLAITGIGGPAPESEPAFWRNYFAFDLDYENLHRVFRRADPCLARCLSAAPGIRVLRQPFFEALLTFLISQNNNIPRIRAITARLCEGLGTPLGSGLNAFPTAEAVARCTEADLAFLRAGWRSAYLIDAAQKLAGGTLTEAMLRAMPTNQARITLRQIKGVGPKVADCTLLYGLGRWDAYPIDVWIKRANLALFPAHARDTAQYLNDRTGGFAGIAQQYIFAWVRANGTDGV